MKIPRDPVALLYQNFRNQSMKHKMKTQAVAKKTSIDLVLEERAKHPQKGYDTKHDNEHSNGELIEAAMAFATAAQEQVLGNRNPKPHAMLAWPWEPDSFRPSEYPMKNLAKACAMLLAEMDRIDRIDPTPL